MTPISTAHLCDRSLGLIDGRLRQQYARKEMEPHDSVAAQHSLTARSSFAVGVALFASVASIEAARLAHQGAGSQPSEQRTPPKGDTAMATAVRPLVGKAWLSVENLRLETAPAKLPEPSSLLKFDMLNESVLPLSDVVVRVSFSEEQAEDAEATPRRVVVGPVTVRVHETIEAGYALSFEMLFRNLSSECGCTPRVEILSARLLFD